MTKEHVMISSSKTTTCYLTRKNRWDHLLARIGVRRQHHRVEPGLYRLGAPDSESPVFVSANYTLSFDALRSSLPGIDGYILVLDTRGVNVWCAAGEGTFGTDEVVRRVEFAKLGEVVSHRKLILPQLGAPGVSAHEVRRRTGFAVEYGPVRAVDLPEYLISGKATPEMRRVRFALRDRLVLAPIEFVHGFPFMLLAAIGLYFLGGILAATAVFMVFLGSVVLFPMLMPWIPSPNFSTKGAFLGIVMAIPFTLIAVFAGESALWWLRLMRGLSYLLPMAAVTAFIALNFTGSTTFTSRSGVKTEIFRYIPVMAWIAAGGVLLAVANLVFRLVRRS